MNTLQVLVIVVFLLSREAFNYRDVKAIGDLDFHENDQGVMEGMRAMKTLTKGLKLMSKGKKGRIFEKSGGYAVAVEDFDRVKPRNVYKGDIYWQGRHGFIGDREITLQRYGSTGRPELYLIQHDENGSGLKWIDTIVYTNY